jgi:NADPH-dependent F420 reductase
MKIAIIGTGHVGSALGGRWSAGGHEVTFGSRDPQGEKARALVASIGGKVRVTGAAEAAKAGEVVLLAVPWSAARNMIAQAEVTNLVGKVLIDATNPLAAGGGLAVGCTTSAAEEIAGWAPGARVVKAFNATGAGNMARPDYGGQRPSLFLCGDDTEAKQMVSQLATEIGFDPVDCGLLPMARYLEPLALLWISLAYNQGMGPDIAFKLLKRQIDRGH